jgi:hypothetical protein
VARMRVSAVESRRVGGWAGLERWPQARRPRSAGWQAAWTSRSLAIDTRGVEY